MTDKPLHALLDDYERAARADGHSSSAVTKQALRAARAAVNEAVRVMEAALAAQGMGG